MFRYFYKMKWLPWSIGGSFLIVFLLWLQAHLATKINVWYGEFYDVLGNILAGKAKLSEMEFYFYLLNFLQLAGISMLVSVFLAFFFFSLVFSMANKYDRILSFSLQSCT